MVIFNSSSNIVLNINCPEYVLSVVEVLYSERVQCIGITEWSLQVLVSSVLFTIDSMPSKCDKGTIFA